MTLPAPTCTAFAGDRRIASGEYAAVAAAVKVAADAGEQAAVQIFDDATGRFVDFDLRGTVEDVVGRLAHAPATHDEAAERETPRGRGRPKLGVVAREITLLPRHWEWLNAQPGGASVALRTLVEAARLAGAGSDRARASQEATHRVMTALGGNLGGYEEALRALYACERVRFEALTEPWPDDVRDYVRALAAAAF